MAVGWIYVALASYNVEYLTWSVSSIENVVDEAAQIAVVDGGGTIVRRREPGKGGVKTSILTEDVIGPHDERIAKGRDWKSLWSEGTDAVMDVPIGGVCEILYGDEREEEER